MSSESESYLETSRNIDSQEQLYKCRHCNNVLPLGQTENCNLCNIAFEVESYYEKPLNIHNEEKKYKCSHCNKSFSYSSSLMRHLRAHTDYDSYPCMDCDKVFQQKSNLIRHQRKHPSRKRKKYFQKIVNLQRTSFTVLIVADHLKKIRIL